MPNAQPTSAASDLIARYHREHRELLGLYSEVKTRAVSRDWVGAYASLSRMRHGLQRHVLSENVNLYAQLERSWRADPEKGRTITVFRIEMEAIGKVALQFFEKYSGEQKLHEAGVLFLADLDAVGTALSKRIADEESRLYPLVTTA